MNDRSTDTLRPKPLHPRRAGALPGRATRRVRSLTARLATGLVACLALASGVAHAEACDLHIAGDLHIDDDALRIERDDRVVLWTREEHLLVDGERIALEATQRAHMRRYAEVLRETLPEIALLAVDGASLGVSAVAQAASGLLDAGTREEVMAAVNAALEESSDRVREELIAGETPIELSDSEMTVKSGTASEDADAADNDGDTLGALILALGLAMTDDAEIEALDARAEALEARADALCDRLDALRDAERAARRAIPVLAGVGMLRQA